MNKLKFQFSIALVCFFLSFAITWQYRGVRKFSRATEQTSARIDKLQEDYKQEIEKNFSLQKQNEELKEEIENYKEKNSSGSNFINILKNELEKIEMDAGIVDISGPGVIVTLSEKKEAFSPVENGNLFVVHDTNLLDTLNELCAAGAEALSLNDERIISTSEIRCVGPTVCINNTRYTSPFEIKAIGDPITLENSLKMRGGIVDNMEYFIDIKIKKVSSMTIKKFKGAKQYKFGKKQ
ncbi:MAG: DUF881 domain-containing protein [Clostridiales bacterium]|jgi:uncharacterized protein YlxW (UPF0749 family)|nr:DUF881 domain-containing protein [Clostridiales bacterium]